MNNPNILGVALTKCFYCLEGDKILLNKTLTPHMASKVEKMNGCVMDMEPCSKCAEYMKQGVIFIIIDESKSTPGWNKPAHGEDHFIPNPYRTGGFAVIKEDAITKFMPDDMTKFALKHRFMFIEQEAANKMWMFPKEEVA
jgi:hypothetical protein